MNTHIERRCTLCGLILLASMTVALVVSPASGHGLSGGHGAHHEHDKVQQASDRSTAVRELLTRFREEGDDAYLEAAWDRIEPALEESAADPDILTEAAEVAQAQHRFDESVELLERSLRLRPNDDQAWLLKSAVHLVQGDTEAAHRACRALRRVPLLVAAACRARVAVARGDAGTEGSVLNVLLDARDHDATQPELVAWAYAVAGDAAEDARAAIERYEQSLRLVERTQVRAALADTFIRQELLGDAQRVLDAGSSALPLDVRRMIVAKRLGRDAPLSDDIDAADRLFRRWIDAEDWMHAREMARFYLDVREQPELARRLAAINLTLQREPEDLRLEQRTRTLVQTPLGALSVEPLRPTLL